MPARPSEPVPPSNGLAIPFGAHCVHWPGRPHHRPPDRLCERVISAMSSPCRPALRRTGWRGFAGLKEIDQNPACLFSSSAGHARPDPRRVSGSRDALVCYVVQSNQFRDLVRRVIVPPVTAEEFRSADSEPAVVKWRPGKPASFRCSYRTAARECRWGMRQEPHGWSPLARKATLLDAATSRASINVSVVRALILLCHKLLRIPGC
jgi:hypothetical protein